MDPDRRSTCLNVFNRKSHLIYRFQKDSDPITYPIDASLTSSLHPGRLLTPFAIYRLRNLYRKYLCTWVKCFCINNHFNCCLFVCFQIAAAVSVSTGCISYGICIAYTSPAIPSIAMLNNTDLTANIGDEEVSLMSKHFF